MKLKLAVKKEPDGGYTSENEPPHVLERAITRFGLLEVTKDGAYFPDRGVLFSKEERAFIMDKGLCREMIDGIFKLKEVFRGEVLTCEGGLSDR
ncbi:MAG: hypothetical protein ACYSTI_10460 [Planctomycetota bacterium]|jgi:hypothetical protein